jgi:glucuronoarabinoxylan endo-1,4-beta-xylanase
MRWMALLLLVKMVIEAQAQSTITINVSKTFQTIEGFGGFGAKKVWWETAPYYDEEYLNKTINNLGATIFRTQIYWDGENVNDNDDPRKINASGFNFGPTSDNGKQFPFLKALNNKGAKILATVWTPPVWMKLLKDPSRIPKECYNCGNCPVSDPRRSVCGGQLNPVYYEEFAEYLVAYVKTLKQKTGVDLYGISIQNEPYFANPFEANVMLPAEYAEVLKVVGQRFSDEGLTTKFFGPEHMAEWSWGIQKKYVHEILEDPDVSSFIDIYAVHGYVDGVTPDHGSAEGWTELYNNITVAHGKPLWMTETSASDEKGYTLAFNMARSLYLALKFGRITAWIYWAMADAVIINNELTPLGYAFKNYYRHIRPGAIRVDAQSTDTDILTLAFKDPVSSALTVILINQSDQQKSVKASFVSSRSQFLLYRTSSSENCRDLGILNSSSIVLPAKSISTVTNAPPVLEDEKKG